jgi:hypothetical protein
MCAEFGRAAGVRLPAAQAMPGRQLRRHGGASKFPLAQGIRILVSYVAPDCPRTTCSTGEYGPTWFIGHFRLDLSRSGTSQPSSRSVREFRSDCNEESVRGGPPVLKKLARKMVKRPSAIERHIADCRREFHHQVRPDAAQRHCRHGMGRRQAGRRPGGRIGGGPTAPGEPQTASSGGYSLRRRFAPLESQLGIPACLSSDRRRCLTRISRFQQGEVPDERFQQQFATDRHNRLLGNAMRWPLPAIGIRSCES